jgi:hypothetical protein
MQKRQKDIRRGDPTLIFANSVNSQNSENFGSDKRENSLRKSAIFQTTFPNTSPAFICILEKANHFFPKSFNEAPI